MGQIDTDIAKIRTRQEAQQKEIDRLMAEAERFRNLKSTDANAIKDAQRYLQNEKLYDGQIDGSWGPKTTAAVQRLLDRNREQQTAATTRMKEITSELAPLNQRRGTLVRQQAEDQAEADLPWYRKAIRDYAGLAGITFGSLAPAGWRALTRRSAESAEGAAARATDALIRPTGTAPERVTGVNQFFENAGAPAPFQVAPAAPLGFAPSPQQASAAGLYPVGNQWMRGADWGREATFATSGALGEVGKSYYTSELADARKAFRDDPTPGNARRVAIAESMLAALTASARFGETGALIYPSASALMRYRPQRPNVNAAGTEVMELNAMLRNRPLDPVEIARRRRDPGFMIVPGTPAPTGDAVRMVSPQGQKMLIQQPDGSWVDERGRPGTPRANWRRISAIETGQNVG